MAKSIGIDLGTTNSCVCYLESKEPQIIPSPEGSRIVPSIVALDRENKRIFGNIAKRQFLSNSQNTIWALKRLIGRNFDSEEIKETKRRVGYKIVKGEKEGEIKVQLGKKLHSPEEIYAMLLGYLKKISEDFLGEPVEDAIITVPAFFNDSQRQATKVSGEIAGLNVLRIINEPTAALIAYRNKITKDGLYAVYDLGGGTFDISIVEVKGEVYKVVSTSGDTYLGGSDFDAKIIDWILGEIKKETPEDIFIDKNTMQRLIQASEKAKIELSFNKETLISIPYLFHFSNGDNYHFQKKLTRSQLEHETIDLVNKTTDLIEESLEELNIKTNQIEKIILVGGQSRMPLISKKLTELFNKAPFTDVNPEEVIAHGAALQSEIMKGKVKDLLLLDVTPLSLGVETKGDKFTKIIERNSTIPIKKSMIFTTISDNQRTVKIHVLQGERQKASQNKSLGFFTLIGIPLAPKGIPQIEVTFTIDANGIVKVKAMDKQTGLSQGMKIQPASGLSPEEIDHMISDSIKYEEEDLQSLKVTQLKDQIQEELETLQFFQKNRNDKLKLTDQTEIKKLLSTAKRELKKDNPDTLESLFKKIQNFRIKINKYLMEILDK